MQIIEILLKRQNLILERYAMILVILNYDFSTGYQKLQPSIDLLLKYDQ